MIKNFLSESRIFLRMSFLELKVNGVTTTLLALVIPVGIMALVFFIGGLSTPDMGIQMLSGNLTLIISQNCIIFLAFTLLQLKLLGGFEQYSVFPINRGSLVFATVLFRMLLLIPFMIILLFISVFIFEVDLNIHPFIIIVIVLAGINLSTIGMLLGVFSNNYHKTNSLLNIIMFVIMFGTPLFYSVKVLPVPVQYIQYMLPFVYIVDAINKLIAFSGYSFQLWLDIIALAVYSILSLTVSSFFFKWQAIE